MLTANHHYILDRFAHDGGKWMLSRHADDAVDNHDIPRLPASTWCEPPAKLVEGESATFNLGVGRKLTTSYVKLIVWKRNYHNIESPLALVVNASTMPQARTVGEPA